MKKLLIIAIIIFNASLAFAQTEKFDILTYTPPKDYAMESKPDYLMFSKTDEEKGQYCLISLYRALPSQGSAKENFAAAWKAIVADQLNPKGEPELTEAAENGVEVVMGSAEVEYNDIAGVGYLTTLTVNNKMVIVLAIFNAETYLQDVQAFIESLDMEGENSPPSESQLTNASSNAKPTSIIGEWSDSGTVISNFVNSSGQYVGDASISTTNNYKFDTNGRYESFFASTTGFKTKTFLYRGTYKVSGNTITLKPTFYEYRLNTKMQPNNDPNNMKSLTFSYNFEFNEDKNVWGIKFTGDENNFVGSDLLYRST